MKMIKITKRKVFIILSIMVLILSPSLYFFGNESSSIHNFRTTKSPLKPTLLSSPSLNGLRELNCSASGRLSVSKINKNFKDLPKKIYVIDVRAEQDVFIRGISAGWLGLHKNGDSITDDLKTTSFFKKPLHHLKWSLRRYINLGSLKAPLPGQYESEKDFLENKGYHYYNFSGERHTVHSDDVIEELIKFFDQLPSDAWVHFHCATGRGRSTTFMILYDIYRNAHKVPLEDIILRQHLLGGENVMDIALRPQGTWSSESLLRRKNLVENFYRYMKDPEGYRYSSWLEWNKKIT